MYLDMYLDMYLADWQVSMLQFPIVSHITMKAKLQHRRTALCSDARCWLNDVTDEGHMVAEAKHDDGCERC